jgi:hypothetical protein
MALHPEHKYKKPATKKQQAQSSAPKILRVPAFLKELNFD